MVLPTASVRRLPKNTLLKVSSMKAAIAILMLTCWFFVGLLVLPSGLLAEGRVSAETFEEVKGIVLTSRGERYEFLLEVARSEKEQAQGLMYRRNLDADAGMLFVFDVPREVSVWMKNTWIPLDVLFVAEEGKIEKIVRQTKPFSLQLIPSDSAVLYVLEVNAGTADRLGLQVGDRLSVAFFK